MRLLLLRSVFPVLVLAALSTQIALAADPTPIHVDTKCPDKTIEYDIAKYAQATVRASKAHQLVSDNSAVVRVSISAAPVRQKGDDKAAPLGISFAVLVRKKAAAGNWDVTSFQSSFVPIDEIETTVRSTVGEALK